MKKLRKIASLLLAMVMVVAMSATAFAANIDVQNAKVGETYKAYQIFTATVSDDNITYYISTSSAYYNDISGSTLFSLVGPNSDKLYQVTWDEDNNNDIIAFLTGLGAKGDAAGSVIATEGENNTVSATIENLTAGYYFVTTSVGSVISIGTAGTTEISEKNGTPTPSKTVSNSENTSGSTNNTANIGDTVYYTVTISDADQISNLVVTDTLSAGLTLNNDVTVKVGESTVPASTATGEGGEEIITQNYTVSKSNYNETTGTTLTIKFEDSYLDTLSSGNVITITYSAVVNEYAVVDGDGNTNEVQLSYGNGQTSTSEKTTTKVYDFDLKKIDDSDDILTGAEFTLSKDSEVYTFVAVSDGYRVATAAEIEDENTETTSTISAGKVNISGLAAGTYTLTETKAPDGYNQLSAPLTVTINENGTVTFNGENVTEVDVVNEAGSELPSTGGIGTTIFYVLGSIMVLGAAVVLITRRRMGKAE